MNTNTVYLHVPHTGGRSIRRALFLSCGMKDKDIIDTFKRIEKEEDW